MPLFLLSNWKWLASGLVGAVLSAFLVALPYRATIANMKREKAEAVADGLRLQLAQFTADADKIHEAADAYTTLQAGLDTRFASISKDFSNAIKGRPLPADCKPDPDRLRSLQAAIDAANTAAGQQPSPAMPKDW